MTILAEQKFQVIYTTQSSEKKEIKDSLNFKGQFLKVKNLYVLR